jgi:hypothetical protein
MVRKETDTQNNGNEQKDNTPYLFSDGFNGLLGLGFTF